MTQTQTRDLAGQPSAAPLAHRPTSSGTGSFTLVLLMPISFVLTILTIVMLQH